jgi:hypothetical protein
MPNKRKPPTRRRKPTPRHPSIAIPLRIEAKPVKGCFCGKPRTSGMTHTAIGCYEEDE